MNMIIIIIVVSLGEANILPQNPLIKAVLFNHCRGPTQVPSAPITFGTLPQWSFSFIHPPVADIRARATLKTLNPAFTRNHLSAQSATSDPTNVLKGDHVKHAIVWECHLWPEVVSLEHWRDASHTRLLPRLFSPSLKCPAVFYARLYTVTSQHFSATSQGQPCWEGNYLQEKGSHFTSTVVRKRKKGR